jgi:hypothetical protein
MFFPPNAAYHIEVKTAPVHQYKSFIFYPKLLMKNSII